jgi:hypothetical protein
MQIHPGLTIPLFFCGILVYQKRLAIVGGHEWELRINGYSKYLKGGSQGKKVF